MLRPIACLAATLLVGTSLRAGELDTEFGPKLPAAAPKAVGPTVPPLVLAPDATAWKASELDEESPALSWRHHGFGWGGWGWGRGYGLGFGWGGWGGGYPLGWGGWGGYGMGWGGYGLGWGGYGMVRTAYYPPMIGYGYGYGMYRPWGCW